MKSRKEANWLSGKWNKPNPPIGYEWAYTKFKHFEFKHLEKSKDALQVQILFENVELGQILSIKEATKELKNRLPNHVITKQRVLNILKESAYCGYLKVPEEIQLKGYDGDYVKASHKAIIDRFQFDIVQEILTGSAWK